MKNIKIDPLNTAMSAIFVAASVGLLVTLPTVAQPSNESGTRSTAPRRPAQNGARPNDNGGPPPPPGGPHDDGKAHGRMLGDMLRGLDLNGKQQDALNSLMESERAKMDALHEQIRQLHQKTRSGVDAILTASQRQKLAQLEKEMERNRPDGPPPGGPQDGPQNGPPR